MIKKKVKMKKIQKVKKLKGLSLHILPFSEVQDLGIAQRVKKILSLVLGNKIVILHGKLRAEEEARLIEDTMALVDHVKNFQGIELAVIGSDSRQENFVNKVRFGLANRLIVDSRAFTVIGPASIIKEIRRDPKKLELMLS